MRSTKASYAIARLKDRSDDAPYSMVTTADGRFYLVLANGDADPEKLNEPMELDEFVRFVNAQGKQTPKKISKLDVAFEAKLHKKPE
ncbi:hypothetical protein [Undibacterium sp.]|uniref:hypothetical protein n=1 Tax=Undibacterium sp. TaxID=1914977 RepID=UPI00374CFC45